MWSNLNPNKIYIYLLPVFFYWVIGPTLPVIPFTEPALLSDSVSLIILGQVQDGGSPHPGCKKKCCTPLFDRPDKSRMVVSLGIVDHSSKKSWMIEAGPDFTRQLELLSRYSKSSKPLPDGILLTHAHIGHYTGLMYLGREAMNSKGMPVYVRPRMKAFLESNGPWSQLVKLENVHLISPDTVFQLSDRVHVKTIPVPHRDEYSETVACWVEGPHKKILFIPDIDKWEKWDRDIRFLIGQADYVFLDATFYNAAEINYRDIKEIPHPFVTESLDYFKSLPLKEKNKIYFIHLNHTNPLLDPNSPETRGLEREGYHVARTGMHFDL